MTELSVISTGELEAGFNESEVIQNLITKFKHTEEDAQNMLGKGTIIRKRVSANLADKLIERFSEFGLKVVSKAIETEQNEQSKTDATNQQSPQTKADFEKLLNGDFTQSKTTLRYRLSLLVALLVSLIAPIIYISILFGVAYLAIFYAGFVSDNIADMSSGILIFAIVVPYFMMTVLALFLIRPLFLTYSTPRYYELRKKDAPSLYSLIAVMCEKISVPFPEQICLDTDVNASAGALLGYSSLSKKKLRLTIGLPLLMGLNVRQFTGVLAHEFGHFAQSSAMKSYYIVNRINFWFYHRAYMPDQWDDRLEEWSDKADWHFAGTLAIFGAKQTIKLTRIIFSLMYQVNYRLTQYMSRAMEYDADSYASRFVGSDQFEQTSIIMRKLSYATKQVHSVNKESWNDECLLANIPLATVYFADNTDAETEEWIKQDMQDGKTSSLDSHPADYDRIAHVTERNDAGIFHAEYPAKDLLVSIDKICEAVTVDTYIKMGIHHPRKHTVANEKIIEQDNKKEALQLSHQHFFNGQQYGRFLDFTPLLTDKPKTHIECMNAIRAESEIFSENFKKYNDQRQHLNQAVLAQHYLRSEIKIDFKYFDLNASNMRELQAEVEMLQGQLRDQKSTLLRTDQLFYERILFNKMLLSNEQNEAMGKLLININRIAALEPSVMELQQYIYLFACLIDCEDELQDKITPTLNQIANAALSASHRVLGATKNIDIEDPKFANISQFLESWCGKLPQQKQTYQLDEHFEAANQICKALHYQYYWHLAEVADLCINVERKANILPLSFPEQSEE